jgi:hypothetical protein
MARRRQPAARRATAAHFPVEVNEMSDHRVSFESDPIGATPEGWTATLTGKGDPKWTVETDEIESLTGGSAYLNCAGVTR